MGREPGFSRVRPASADGRARPRPLSPVASQSHKYRAPQSHHTNAKFSAGCSKIAKTFLAEKYLVAISTKYFREEISLRRKRGWCVWRFSRVWSGNPQAGPPPRRPAAPPLRRPTAPPPQQAADGVTTAIVRSVRAGRRRSRNSPAAALWPVGPPGAAPRRPGWAAPG
jgi:hypothetical protein